MRRRLSVPLFVAALLLVFSTMAAACGDDDRLTLEEYFQRFVALDQEVSERQRELEAEFPRAFEDPDETRDRHDAGIEMLREALEKLDGIDPPAEAEDAHKEVVAATKDRVESAESISAQLAVVESISEMREVFQLNSAEVDEAFQRLDRACLELQEIADDDGMDVDLECGEEEG